MLAGPVMVGAAGGASTVTAYVPAALVPQGPDVPVTLMVPEPAAAAPVTVIVAVPCPVKEAPTVAGTVHVYEVAAPEDAVYVFDEPVHIVAGPVMTGVEGTVLSVTVTSKVLKALVPQALTAATETV